MAKRKLTNPWFSALLAYIITKMLFCNCLRHKIPTTIDLEVILASRKTEVFQLREPGERYGAFYCYVLTEELGGLLDPEHGRFYVDHHFTGQTRLTDVRP